MTKPEILLDQRAMLWSSQLVNQGRTPLLIMMHGRGGVEQDMSQYFAALPEGLRAVSLRAPVPLRDRWSWFDDPRRPDAAVRLNALVHGILDWIETLTGFAPIGLMGFSQGGAMAVQLMRHAPHRFYCAVHLSAFVLPDPVPTDHVLQAVRPPVLTGHGDLDDVIEADEPLRGLDFLRRHTTLTERSYAGLGHEVSDHMLEDSMQFVDARLGR